MDEDLANLRVQRLAMFLESHFGNIELRAAVDEAELKSEGEMKHKNGPQILIRVDGSEASINLLTLVRPLVTRKTIC